MDGKMWPLETIKKQKILVNSTYACEVVNAVVTIDGDNNDKEVSSKFKINSSGMLCCNTKFAISFFQENVSSL